MSASCRYGKILFPVSAEPRGERFHQYNLLVVVKTPSGQQAVAEQPLPILYHVYPSGALKKPDGDGGLAPTATRVGGTRKRSPKGSRSGRAHKQPRHGGRGAGHVRAASPPMGPDMLDGFPPHVLPAGAHGAQMAPYMGGAPMLDSEMMMMGYRGQLGLQQSEQAQQMMMPSSGFPSEAPPAPWTSLLRRASQSYDGGEPEPAEPSPHGLEPAADWGNDFPAGSASPPFGAAEPPYAALDDAGEHAAAPAAGAASAPTDSLLSDGGDDDGVAAAPAASVAGGGARMKLSQAKGRPMTSSEILITSFQEAGPAAAAGGARPRMKLNEAKGRPMTNSEVLITSFITEGSQLL